MQPVRVFCFARSIRWAAFMIGFISLSASCGSRHEPSWLPQTLDEREEVVVKTDASFDGTPKQMVATLYVDNDGKRGADMCLRIYATRKWRLAAATPGRPGMFNVPVANGVVSADGTLEELHWSFFRDAKGIWSRHNMADFTINDEAVPDS